MKRLLLFLYCSFHISIVLAQTADANNVDALAGNFIKDLQKNNQEKIFVHTGKWYYTPGETIWLKAYCINAFTHKLSTVSKSMFIDLVNDRDSVVENLVFNIPDHKTDGSIRLPFAIPEGYYWLRAYTKKMLKDDKNNISVQPVYVVSNRVPLKTAKEEITNERDENTIVPVLTFFPEGGSIISGTNNIIGFTATGKGGQPLVVSGYVTDNRDTVIAKFTTGLPGIGKFSLPAWNARKYTAHISWQDKKDISYQLPLIDPFASQLSVPDQNANAIHVVVSLGDSLYKKNKSTCLVVLNREKLLFAGVGRDMYELNMPVNNFPGGRTQLILFNEKQQVISERSVFISNKNLLNAGADKINYNKREKATLTILAGDSINHPAASLLSVAVTDDNQVDETMNFMDVKNLLQDNISFLSDSFLIDNHNQDDRDLIMLTQKPSYTGWKYNGEINEKQSTFFENDSSVTGIGGQIMNNKKMPAARQTVTLLINDKLNFIDTDTTDVNGHFYFKLPPGADSVEFTLQVMNEKNKIKEEKIVLDRPDLPVFSTPGILKKKFNTQQTTVINHFKIKYADFSYTATGKEYLPEVKVTAAPDNTGIDPKRRVSSFSHVIVYGERERENSMSTSSLILSSPGVTLRQGFLMLKGGPNNIKSPSATDEPLIVMDGVPLSTSSNADSPTESSPALALLGSISPSTIDFIEILSGPEAAAYGVRSLNGVVVVNTINGATRKDAPAGIGKLNYVHKGYAVPNAFAAPDYSRKEYKKLTLDDLRSTIYWNANVPAGKDGKCSVSFYTADAATTYTVTIMGISSDGAIMYKKIKVNRK